MKFGFILNTTNFLIIFFVEPMFCVRQGKPGKFVKFPYAVVIHNFGDSCGGSIIAKQYVLTAAHCLKYNKAPQAMAVRAGNTYSSRTIVSRVTKAFAHINYNEDGNYGDDIAMLKTQKKWLPYHHLDLWSKDMPSISSKGKIAGYGGTENGAKENDLLWTEVEIVDSKYCGITKLDKQFCAGDLHGIHDGCVGDSGLSFVINDIATGILSAGMDCLKQAQSARYSKYTFIGYYNRWIIETMEYMNIK